MAFTSNPAIKRLYKRIQKTAAHLEDMLQQIKEKLAIERASKSNKDKKSKTKTAQSKTRKKSLSKQDKTKRRKGVKKSRS